MLKRLTLENFKAWREADLTFGKVTGFFGANSAGKSSLLHLLLLLKQTRNATDRGIVLDFGGRGEMVNLREVIAIDDRRTILEEYGKHLRSSGMPGTGDMFYKFLLNNQYRAERVRLVAVTPSEDDRRGFEELPENMFDPSDRKFLAVAVVAKAVVLNATDSDWDEHAVLMEELGVKVSQLCPEYASKEARLTC